MSYIVLHINEFNYLLFSGALRIHNYRFITLLPPADGIELFQSAGYLKYSSPESYILCGIDSELISSHHGKDAPYVSLNMADVTEIVPITTQAELLLRPVIDRARLLIKTPIFEAAWQRFVDEEILRERRQAAIAFAELFGFDKFVNKPWEEAPDLFQFIHKDLGSGLNEIERRSASAELGIFEFCVRLAHEHDAAWRRDNPIYIRLKQVRESELARKKLADVSFLSSTKVCLALRDFEEESYERFRYSPFSLVAFFEFYRTHSRANGINFKQIRSTIEFLLTYGRTQDASDYTHLIGYSLGHEEVTPAMYFSQADRFPMFDHSHSDYPKSKELFVTPPSEVLDLFAASAENQSEAKRSIAPDEAESKLATTTKTHALEGASEAKKKSAVLAPNLPTELEVSKLGKPDIPIVSVAEANIGTSIIPIPSSACTSSADAQEVNSLLVRSDQGLSAHCITPEGTRVAEMSAVDTSNLDTHDVSTQSSLQETSGLTSKDLAAAEKCRPSKTESVSAQKKRSKKRG